MANPFYVGSALVTGSGTSRSVPVSVATGAGDTISMMITVNTATLTISSVADSKGNVYSRDLTYTTTLPYLFIYRSPGPTGGSGGGATAALTTSDTFTVTTAAVSGQMTASVLDIPGVTALDTNGGTSSPGSVTTGSAAVTPAANGVLCIGAAITQPSASALSVSGSFTNIDTRQPGSGSAWTTWAYEQLAPGTGSGVAQTFTMNWTTAVNWRGNVISFVVPSPVLLPQQLIHRGQTSLHRRMLATYGR